MYQPGDLVVYGNVGVCIVEKVGAATIAGANDEKDYYSLIPYYSTQNRVVIPCDNTRVALRPIMTRKQADDLINNILDVQLMDIPNEKVREVMYKDTIKSCDGRSMVSLIKTIYQRKVDRKAEGKKITASDEKYFLLAEDKLYGELSVVFGIEKKCMRSYINKRVTENQQA